MSCRPVCSLFLALLAALPLVGEEVPRVDRYGDPLPPHALARLGTVRFRHGSEINCLAYSANGKFLASGGADGMIVLWDAQSGRRIRRLARPDVCLNALAFSPDSKLLVSANNYDAQTRIGTCRMSDLRLWDVATGKLVFRTRTVEDWSYQVAFSPNGKAIASEHGGKCVHLWDVRTGERLRTWESENNPFVVSSLAFAPDGKMLAVAGADGHILFWDLQTGNELTRQGKPSKIGCAAFSPDGAIFATGNSNSLRLYRTSTLEEIRSFEGQQEKVDALTFCPDGKALLSWGKDETIRLWQVASGKQLWQIPQQKEWKGIVAVSPDGKTIASAAGYRGGLINLWDAETGKARPTPGSPVFEMQEVAFLRDGDTVASRYGSSDWVVWARGTGKESRPVKLPLGSDNCMLGSDRSTLAVTTTDGALVLVDLLSGRELFRRPVAKDFAVVALSPDNKRAVVKGRSIPLQVLDLTTKKANHCFESGICFLALSQDGRMIAGRSDQQVLLWNLNTNKEVGRCGYSELGLWSASAFSPDGRMIATFSPDGRMIATCNYGHPIHLWETATSKERRLFQGHLDHISSLAFSPDGRTLASGSADSTVRLWDIWDGKELQVFHGHLGEVTRVDFSPDGRRLVSGSHDTSALVWEIPASCQKRKPAVVRFGQQEQLHLWGKLADQDAATAYAALQRLAADAETVSLCRAKFFVPPTPPEKVRRWIAQLDDEEYTIREQASQALEGAEGDAEKALKSALQPDCSPEVRRRIEALLEILQAKQLPIRPLRVVELLEQIGTAEAVDVLCLLEKQTPDAGLRGDVQRSLRRLAQKPSTR